MATTFWALDGSYLHPNGLSFGKSSPITCQAPLSLTGSGSMRTTFPRMPG
jgi:hypothetical protein